MIPEKITSIEQRAFLRGYQKFEIRPDGDLEITFRRYPMHNQFKVPLWHLNPSPTRIKYFQVGTLVGIILLALLNCGIFLGIIASRKDIGTAEALVVPFLCLILFLGVCIWNFRVKSVNATVFTYRNGRGQLHIWHAKPDPKTYEAFCESLARHATEAWNSRPVEPAANTLAGELAALKKLRDTGVLNDAEFERAKAKLLEQQEEKRIGFK